MDPKKTPYTGNRKNSGDSTISRPKGKAASRRGKAGNGKREGKAGGNGKREGKAARGNGKGAKGGNGKSSKVDEIPRSDGRHYSVFNVVLGKTPIDKIARPTIHLSEMLGRKDLNTLERGMILVDLYYYLIATYSIPLSMQNHLWKTVQEILGIGSRRRQEIIKIWQGLPCSVRQKAAKHMSTNRKWGVSERQLKKIISLSSNGEKEEVFREVLENKLTLDETKKLVNDIKGIPTPRSIDIRANVDEGRVLEEVLLEKLVEQNYDLNKLSDCLQRFLENNGQREVGGNRDHDESDHDASDHEESDHPGNSESRNEGVRSGDLDEKNAAEGSSDPESDPKDHPEDHPDDQPEDHPEDRSTGDLLPCSTKAKDDPAEAD